ELLVRSAALAPATSEGEAAHDRGANDTEHRHPEGLRGGRPEGRLATRGLILKRDRARYNVLRIRHNFEEDRLLSGHYLVGRGAARIPCHTVEVPAQHTAGGAPFNIVRSDGARAGERRVARRGRVGLDAHVGLELAEVADVDAGNDVGRM